MNATETCCCGASMTATTYSLAATTSLVHDFRDAHRVCRERGGQTPEADTSSGTMPAGRPSASGACPCKSHGDDPDGDCGERCA